MIFIILSIAIVLASYLMGSISSAVIVARLWGLPDPRTVGSHNPGATNMLRIGSKGAAVCTLLGDALKGFMPVYVTRLYFIHYPVSSFVFEGVSAGSVAPWIISAVFLATILGHLYPVFFEFKGGKGLATVLGGLFGLTVYLGFSFILIWMTVAILTRYSALAGLVTMACMPIVAYAGLAPEYAPVLLLIGLLIFWRHRVNIRNLCAGKESKIKIFK